MAVNTANLGVGEACSQLALLLFVNQIPPPLHREGRQLGIKQLERIRQGQPRFDQATFPLAGTARAHWGVVGKAAGG